MQTYYYVLLESKLYRRRNHLKKFSEERTVTITNGKKKLIFGYQATCLSSKHLKMQRLKLNAPGHLAAKLFPPIRNSITWLNF